MLAQSDVIGRQSAEIEGLAKRAEALEAKQGKPPRTPDKTSVPPSRGQKPKRAERRAARKQGRPGAFRGLSETPDRVVEAGAEACPHCAPALTDADQPDDHACDHSELPPIEPVATRIHRHRGSCPCCRRGFAASAPAGMAPGSPFGPGLAALILHLQMTRAISFERLLRLLEEVSGVTISEGAIAELLARAEAPMIVAAEKTALGAGDSGFAPGFERLLLRAVAIGRRRETLEDSTLARYRADLDRRLTGPLAAPTASKAGQKLARAIRKCHDDRSIFVTRRDLPYTNNGCERALRPSVIFRKVTGCFRSHWGARLYAAAASVVATGRLNRKSARQAIRDVLAPTSAPVTP